MESKLYTHLGRVKLDTSLDDINRGQSSVGDGAADTTSGSSLDVVHGVVPRKVGGRRGEENGSSSRHGC
jgi:hypothetical protein